MDAEPPRLVAGSLTGLAFPPSIEDLMRAGPAFLTRAFQATGALAADNAVIAIRQSSEFVGGGMGRKLWLEVEYREPVPGMHNALFAKFPRDFGDPLRELFGPLMEPEVRFALLSRQPDFPVTVPKCYFADYDPETVSGILITERIRYGEGSIEPCPEKCMDYKLADPLPYYEALTRSMARLAGFHKAGKLGAELPQQFPFDPAIIDPGSRIPYTPAQLQEKLDKIRQFAAAAPQLFPDGLGATPFLDQFIAEVPLVLEHEIAIRQYLNQRADMIALCHWNMNLDNAWFWTDDEGVFQAGLLDWGSVAQMNVAQAFFGMTCAGETDFLNAHKHNLIRLFVEQYANYGGPVLDANDMAFAVKLSMAVLGVAWMLDAPSLVEQQVPDFAKVRDRFDPAISGDFLARAQAHLLLVLMNEWRHDNIGGAIRDFAARQI